jgi:hypothetical protein
MSIEHKSIMDLFEPARALEPRDSEIRDALALALAEPPRSPAHASVANILGAVIALAIAFAVVGVRGFAAPSSKKHQRHVELVGAARRESTAIDIAALARIVQARQTRVRSVSPGGAGVLGSDALDILGPGTDHHGESLTVRATRAPTGARQRQPAMAADTHFVRAAVATAGFSSAPGSVRAREQRRGPSRRARCECARSLSPPRIALAESRGRPRG